MKKILVLSDTHSYIDDRIEEHAKNSDEVWHAGDFGSLEVLRKTRVNTPEISDQVLSMFNYFFDVILNRKTICFFLNRSINDKKNQIKFEHEWSHALNEYHEFIVFSLEANECFSIILAYD